MKAAGWALRHQGDSVWGGLSSPARAAGGVGVVKEGWDHAQLQLK